MRAFVFSGGANRGALQAGAALALLEAGIKPDIVVGSSVGAINAAVLASQPSVDGIRTIAQRWRTMRRETIFPGNALTAAWRLARGEGSLHSNHALRRFLRMLLPHGSRHFGDLHLPLYVTAMRYEDGQMHLFGHEPGDDVIGALMASAAVPPYLPPYRYRDTLYLDGGFVSNLPIATALELGATEIWALEIGVDAFMPTRPIGLRTTLSRTVETLMRLQVRQERELVRLLQRSQSLIHHIQMLHFSGIDVRDFSHSSTLLDLGYESAQLYLAERKQLAPAPLPRPAAPERSTTRVANIGRTRLRTLYAEAQRALRSRGRLPIPLPIEPESPTSQSQLPR